MHSKHETDSAVALKQLNMHSVTTRSRTAAKKKLALRPHTRACDRRTPPCKHPRTCPHIRTQNAHRHTHTHTHTQSRAGTHARTRIHAHTRAYTRTRARTQSHMRACTHARRRIQKKMEAGGKDPTDLGRQKEERQRASELFHCPSHVG